LSEPISTKVPTKFRLFGQDENCCLRETMSNEFYDPGEQRAAKVKELFTRIAPRYDLMNDVQSFGLHRYWKRRLVAFARPQPGERALDLCCGTGDLTLALAQAGADAVGLDFSERMLEAARAKCITQKPGAGAPRFVQGDAQQVPFADNSFDVVTIGYGLRNLTDWRIGLREMQRVAKPGGRLLVLDFGKPEHPLWRRIYFGYLRLFVPCLGRVFCGSASAYAYILESLEHYPAQQQVAEALRQLDLTQVRVVNLLGGAMAIHFAEKK
jgi:demethylmenaquinone methyltransferase / 2-methoxy-6-polyprenyl-1,4-benzoquinol methylase